jgi:hypothetical protein
MSQTKGSGLSTVKAAEGPPLEDRWTEASARLLAAIDESRRPAATEMLGSLHRGATGLRDWVMAIAWRGAVVPAALPGELAEWRFR